MSIKFGLHESRIKHKHHETRNTKKEKKEKEDLQTTKFELR